MSSTSSMRLRGTERWGCKIKWIQWQEEWNKWANTVTQQLPSYLESDDKTKSDGEKLPVEQRVVSIVVSERFISTEDKH